MYGSKSLRNARPTSGSREMCATETKSDGGGAEGDAGPREPGQLGNIGREEEVYREGTVSILELRTSKEWELGRRRQDILDYRFFDLRFAWIPVS